MQSLTSASKVVGPGTTTYNVWDDWNLVEERGAGNALQNTYLYDAVGIIERMTGASKYFYFQDALRNTSHVSDEPGNLLESYKYGTFGQQSVYSPAGVIRPGGSSYDIRHLFTGQLWMPQVGLYDYRNRVYSPTLTRFLQPDPISFKGDRSNLYRYCANDPLNRRDPNGTQSFFIPRDGEVERGSQYLMGAYGLFPQPDGAADALIAEQQMQDIELMAEIIGVLLEKGAEHIINDFFMEKGIILPHGYPDPADHPRNADGGRENPFSHESFELNFQDRLVSYSPISQNPGFEIQYAGEVIEYDPLPNGSIVEGGGDSISDLTYGRYDSSTAAAANWEASWGNGSAFGIAGGGYQGLVKKKY